MKKLVLALFVLTFAAGALEAKSVKKGYKQEDYQQEDYQQEQDFKQDNDYQQEQDFKQDNDYQQEEYKGDECD